MISRFLVVMIILTASVAAHATDVRVSVTEVKDSRTTGQFFNNLDIKLKLTGDDIAGAKGIRTVVTSAVDDTGRNLLKDEDKSQEFKPLQDSDLGAEVELRFKNPARKSSVVKEITGEVHLFMPVRDPSATVILKSFKTLTGKPVSDPALVKAGMQLTVLTKKEYDILAKQHEQQAIEEAEKNLEQAMVEVIKGMFGSFFQVGENDVLLKIDDPDKKFIKAEVLNAKGEVIHNSSTTSANDMRVLGFDENLPADAQLRIFLKTPKSVVVVPLKLADIALP